MFHTHPKMLIGSTILGKHERYDAIDFPVDSSFLNINNERHSWFC